MRNDPVAWLISLALTGLWWVVDGTDWEEYR
jgi:hypothetical protein